jgi:hypothetical protein
MLEILSQLSSERNRDYALHFVLILLDKSEDVIPEKFALARFTRF